MCTHPGLALCMCYILTNLDQTSTWIGGLRVKFDGSNSPPQTSLRRAHLFSLIHDTHSFGRSNWR